MAVRRAENIVVIANTSWMRLAQECRAWHKQREAYLYLPLDVMMAVNYANEEFTLELAVPFGFTASPLL